MTDRFKKYFYGISVAIYGLLLFIVFRLFQSGEVLLFEHSTIVCLADITVIFTMFALSIYFFVEKMLEEKYDRLSVLR